VANLTKDKQVYDADADEKYSSSGPDNTSTHGSFYKQEKPERSSTSNQGAAGFASGNTLAQQEEGVIGGTPTTTSTSGTEKESSYFVPSRHKRRVSARGWLKKRKTIIGAGVGISGILFSILFSFAPILKLEFIFQGLSERAGASNDYAVGQRVDVLMGNYLTRKYFQNAGYEVYVGDTLYSTLYGNWASAKFENQLYTDYGINFEALDSNGNRITSARQVPTQWQVSLSDTDPIKIKGTTIDLDLIDSPLDKREFKRVVKAALKEETRFSQVLKRWHLWRIIKNKYQVPNRFIPKLITDTKASYINKKRAVKKWLFTRAASAFSSHLGSLMACFLDKNECSKILDQRRAAESSLTPEEQADLNSELDDLVKQLDETPDTDTVAKKLIQDKINNINSQLSRAGGEVAEKATKETVEEMFDNPQAAFEKVFKNSKLVRFFTSTLAKKIIVTIGIVGVVNILAKIDEGLQSNSIGRATYDLQSLNMINATAPYITAASQLKSGDLDSEEAGLLLESFDGFEKSIIYQMENTGYDPAQPTPEGTVPTKIAYDCDGDQVIDTNPETSVDYVTPDNPICSKMILAKDYTLFTSQSWYQSTISPLLGVFRNTVGRLINWAGGLFDAIISPIINPILDATGINNAISNGVEYALGQFVSPACTNLEEGALAYDCIRGGVELMNNSVAQEALNGIGGAYQTAAEHNLVMNYQMDVYDEDWKHEPLFARLFSTESYRSLLARAVVGTPSTVSDTATTIAHAVTTPLSSLSSLFSSLFSPVNAQDTLPDDYNPYEIVHYGYDLNDPNLQAEPGTGVYADCETGKYDDYEDKRDAEIAGEAPDDYEDKRDAEIAGEAPEDAPWPVATTPNYCALEKTAIEAAGAVVHAEEGN